MEKPTELMDKPEWGKRRRRLDIALIFIAVWISFILFKGEDTVIYQQALIAMVGAAVALITQYVFGAVFDDKNYMNALKDMYLGKK